MRFFITICSIVYLFPSLPVAGQNEAERDSVKKESLTRKTFMEGLKLITTNPSDTIVNEESINPYTAYTGKIIRNILIKRIGFEKSIYDSTKKVKKTVTQIANFLHTDTREKTIRKHLFFSENELLNPYKVADNERFLRDKDFIMDSRMLITPVEGTDSVDITVVTRDVFSLGGSIGGTIPSAPLIKIFDANVDGRGQRIQLNTLIDQSRSPKVGYALLYRKSSIFGSLTNLELGYNQLNEGYSFGDENEYALQVKLDRPLVSPYTRLAGGGEVSQNWSENVDTKPDSVFLQYKYKLANAWIGYNIGIKKELLNRNRKFFAVRVFDGIYIDQPDQYAYREERKYNNIYGYLSEFTFYRQDFYKTRYVFGFGTTEDVPYGFTFGATGGYVSQLKTARPYGAFKLDYGKVRPKGEFVQLGASIGGYLQNEKFEDVILQGGFAYYTQVINVNRYKTRNVLSATYTQLINQKVIDWLYISKSEIPGFNSDSLKANQRFAVHGESVLYTPWSLLGFRFAPFAAVDMVYVNCVQCLTKNELYWGLSSGLRTRNENLIFGTMELKMTYIPNDQYGKNKFVIGFKQNLRVKNTGTFVQQPALISYN